MAKTKSKKKEPAYSIAVTLGDKTFEGSGESALEALGNVPRPSKIMGKMFITAHNGTRRADFMLMPQRAKRFFYPHARFIQAKYLDMRMK